MAVKVGNSWVSEAAYEYAKSRVNKNTCAEDKKENSMLDKLSEKYPDIQFSTNTKPFSGTGKNNIGIAPNILREMENDPEKRLEYEALIYDCNEVIKNMPDKTQNGSTIKSFGFIINPDGSLGGWSISESGGNTNRSRYSLDKDKKDSWLDKILEKKEQKKIEEKRIEKKKIEEKRQLKREEQAELQEQRIKEAGSAKSPMKIAGNMVDLKA
ncbi:MAG: hypothetical protein K2N94_14935 [Lachnospiraceae bacterium]|nr:hypothetical protein [Lachnospiraceae bacterium]